MYSIPFLGLVLSLFLAGGEADIQISILKLQKIPLNSSMLNGSFLLLVQNLPGPKQPSHSESWLDNGSIVDISLNGSVVRRD